MPGSWSVPSPKPQPPWLHDRCAACQGYRLLTHHRDGYPLCRFPRYCVWRVSWRVRLRRHHWKGIRD